MVISAEREKLKQGMVEREAEKQRSRALKEAARAERELKRRQEVAGREQKRKEREALEAERELKKKEKEARKQLEEAKKQQVEAEREQRRKEREAAEGEREAKRKERELKRQRDEAEKEQKREEKEAAERKKQLLLQKQANIMTRLFRRKEADAFSPQGKHSSADHGLLPCPDQQITLGSHSTSRSELSTVDVTLRLDETLTSTCLETEEELLRSHVVSWQEKWKCRSSRPFRRWGVRITPKVIVFPELRLQSAGMGSSRRTDFTANGGSFSSSEVQEPSLKRRRQEDVSFDDCNRDDSIIVLDDDADAVSSPIRKKQCNSRWKLLQFDKSHRPAYYGTFSKSSSTVGPRHPLRQDSSLDYEVDSDEEWEEEDPGESLSDCEDKEDEIEKTESDLVEDAADGFVVPDGYLSESEGVLLEDADTKDMDMDDKAVQFPSPGESGTIVESSGSMYQMVCKHQHHMKLLDNVTKHALQRNRPFLVSDLLQQAGEECASTQSQTDRLCFQALRMCIVAPNILIEPPAIELQG